MMTQDPPCAGLPKREIYHLWLGKGSVAPATFRTCSRPTAVRFFPPNPGLEPSLPAPKAPGAGLDCSNIVICILHPY